MKYTFGKTLAAQRLEILLNENPSARRKIMALLSKYTNQMLKITAIKDKETVDLCLNLLKSYTLKRIDLKENISPDIRSYTKNIVIFRHRIFRRTFDDFIHKMVSYEKLKKDLTFGDEMV